MKRDRASSEEEAEAGKAAVERRAGGRGGRASEPAVDGSNTPGLRVHEWGLNPLFWIYGPGATRRVSGGRGESGPISRSCHHASCSRLAGSKPYFIESYVKLLIRDVHGLGTLGGIDDSHVLHGNKAIHRVEVSGVVVHVKPGATKASGSFVKYILDDGTGLMPCTQYERHAGTGATHRGHSERHELGELLVVQGKLKRYRGAREVAITSASKPTDPNQETLHWLRCVELGETVYRSPFQRDDYIDEELVAGSSQARPTQCGCGAAYAEAVGYCRCVAAPLALDPAFEFRDALLARLAVKEESLAGPDEHLRFQFARDVRDDPSLKTVAARVVAAAAAAAARSGTSEGQRPAKAGAAAAAAPQGVMQQAKVLELLRAVMSSLHRDGALHFLDRARDVYVLVSRGRVLQPAVEEACRRRRLGLSQENEIIRALQGSALLHHVPGARIRACVHLMKQAGRSAQQQQQQQKPGSP
ncbi:unnamed protein product [Ectocarpus sp. CCAP 1310/34]|nr:unnamed protein product [Ectocarpus sp. CCAP 1310/34]